MDVSLTIRIALAGALVATSLPTLAKVAKPVSQTLAVPSCNWDRPGHEPFMGDVVKAVDFYRDIPPDVRERLKARMARRDYDDLVSIRRDSITGKAKYGSTIRDMHFGDQRVCRSVTRDTWTPSMQERGLVYCDSGQCILVPTVCRNVSRITRAEVSPDHAEAPVAGIIGGAGPDEGGPTTLASDTGPSFAAPDAVRGPLDVGGGPGGTDSGTPSPQVAGGVGFPTFFFPSPGTAIVPGGLAVPPGVPPPGGGEVPPPVPVPEPGTWALMLSGLAGLALLSRRSKRS